MCIRDRGMEAGTQATVGQPQRCHRVPFAQLSPEDQEVIRAKQAAAKQAKHRQRQRKKPAAPEQPQQSSEYPSLISSEDYFGECYGLFYDPSLQASEASLELLLSMMASGVPVAETGAGNQITLGQFQYFIFAGSWEQVWEHHLFARLAFEGFFVITTDRDPGRGNKLGQPQPLPELQPFYSVLDWDKFGEAKHVRKVLRKLRKHLAGEGSPRYVLSNNNTGDAIFEALNQYHIDKSGTNWMTRKYYDTMKAADQDGSINFKMHCIGMHQLGDKSGDQRLIAGEIGFSVGMVYTLSLIHISEPTRLLSISYAVFCLKKKKKNNTNTK
eukprot:TRINITY_DN3186_c0_g1_i2.p1 TRINITY_DN3186_c0_g1~~TRINITY_DN3186_c0_g1_i2.p1  ORF type:complete len:327 (+),score=111.88 TRINITY_DN3186_c0_g1_i2:156-1136(+)